MVLGGGALGGDEVIRKGGAPMNGTTALRRETQSAPSLLPPREDTADAVCEPVTGPAQTPDLPAPSSQTPRPPEPRGVQARVDEPTPSAVFCDSRPRALRPREYQLIWFFLGQLW